MKRIDKWDIASWMVALAIIVMVVYMIGNAIPREHAYNETRFSHAR